MKTFTSEIVGKTVEQIVGHGDLFCMHFTDGTYCCLYADDDEIYPTGFESRDPDAVRVGVATLQEQLAASQAFHAEQRAKGEAAERETYERLKAKFEVQP